LRRLGGVLGDAGDLCGGVLVRRGARDKVEVLVVLRRRPVGGLPVAPRGVGGGHVRRKQFKREHPGAGRVPGERHRAVLGHQDVGCHRPRRATARARHHVQEQFGDLAQRDRDLPLVLPEDSFPDGAPQVVRPDRGPQDDGDRTLGALQQLPAAKLKRERRDELLAVADLAHRPGTARDLLLRHPDEPLALALPDARVHHGLDTLRADIAHHGKILDMMTSPPGGCGTRDS